jgi:CSLREA domain-containing protein
MKTFRFHLWGLILTLSLVLGLFGGIPHPALAASFVVNSNADDASAHDNMLGDGVCMDQSMRCTLRAAIEEANALAGADTITFATAMTITIDLAEGVLPSLDETATIDASSVWDTANHAPGVVLDGQGGSFSGLYLGDDGCQVYGLYITNFGGDGILVVSAANWIGGAGAGQRNVLSGNGTGISLYSSAAQGNILHNNYLGPTPAGNAKKPNDTGLYIGNGAKDNIIGGNDAAHVNVISGNTSNGVMIEGSGTDDNWLGGNAIGLGADLSGGLGNGAYGIRIQNGPANTIIGGASGSGNMISYNSVSGVYVLNAGGGTRITDNILGSNGADGIDISYSSGCVVSNNLIGSNTLNGVRVIGAAAAGNLIWPNSIFGNGEKGICLQNGGNMGIAAPVITNANSNGAVGTTCASCRVALYSDSSDEGQLYHGIVQADGAGNWTYSGLLVGPNVTATSIDVSGNTSEFLAPYSISNNPPNTPANPSPANAAVGVSRTPTLTWTGGDPDGDVVQYTVYGQEASAVVSDVWCAASTSLSCQPGFALKENTKYYWYVSASDQKGGQVDGTFWEFTTGGGSAINHKIFLPLTLK